MAQRIAIGALDARLDHAGGKQHQRHRTGQMQKDDRTAHARPRDPDKVATSDQMNVRIMDIASAENTPIAFSRIIKIAASVQVGARQGVSEMDARR
ncbi:hypothetical protein MesoLj131a_22990 [Mesorhizobium sp. 131-2-1]|nr:hypothetical protein MesoLj131a_22990 [Mesorhizobium sp. 131-2-1]